MTLSTMSPLMEIDFNEYSKKIDETLIAMANEHN